MDFTFKRSDQRALGFGLHVFIYGTGDITPGTTARLRDFLQRNRISEGVLTLYLNSSGGSLGEGMTLGRFIRDRGMDTAVSTPHTLGRDAAFCLSACSIAFLGGVQRYEPLSGRVLGVHRFYFTGEGRPAQESDVAQVVSPRVVAYLREMGVDTGFFTEMTRAGREEINVLSAARMRELNVVTPAYRTTWDIALPMAGPT
jgi:hypothetical protein